MNDGCLFSVRSCRLFSLVALTTSHAGARQQFEREGAPDFRDSSRFLSTLHSIDKTLTMRTAHTNYDTLDAIDSDEDETCSLYALSGILLCEGPSVATLVPVYSKRVR